MVRCKTVARNKRRVVVLLVLRAHGSVIFFLVFLVGWIPVVAVVVWLFLALSLSFPADGLILFVLLMFQNPMMFLCGHTLNLGISGSSLDFKIVGTEWRCRLLFLLLLEKESYLLEARRASEIANCYETPRRKCVITEAGGQEIFWV